MKGSRIILRGVLGLVILLASCAGYQEAEKTAAEQAAEVGDESTVRYLAAASPVIVRKIIRTGRFVHPSLVRTYEFLNYYSFDYAPPVEQSIGVDPQLRALDGEGDFSLQVAVRSQDRTLPELSPFNITFLLDTSGSLAGAPLELSRALILGIAGKLRPDDRISLVTCNRQTDVTEADNNYFQNPFHPIPNTGTGFGSHGSTGWLRTSWPIRGGERFTLTFSIHDEGDGIYDSLVILDNFRWHGYDAVGTTDPLN